MGHGCHVTIIGRFRKDDGKKQSAHAPTTIFSVLLIFTTVYAAMIPYTRRKSCIAVILASCLRKCSHGIQEAVWDLYMVFHSGKPVKQQFPKIFKLLPHEICPAHQHWARVALLGISHSFYMTVCGLMWCYMVSHGCFLELTWPQVVEKACFFEHLKCCKCMVLLSLFGSYVDLKGVSQQNIC